MNSEKPFIIGQQVEYRELYQNWDGAVGHVVGYDGCYILIQTAKGDKYCRRGHVRPVPDQTPNPSRQALTSPDRPANPGPTRPQQLMGPRHGPTPAYNR